VLFRSADADDSAGSTADAPKPTADMVADAPAVAEVEAETDGEVDDESETASADEASDLTDGDVIEASDEDGLEDDSGDEDGDDDGESLEADDDASPSGDHGEALPRGRVTDAPENDDDQEPSEAGGAMDESEDIDSLRIERAFRLSRDYKIQEVIKRRQIMLIQVSKEERGSKGAALTTYISLAGRYCVLMPNSPAGGGISRKITSAADRKRLKEIVHALDVPKGMSLILRTAGLQRSKAEIKRDFDYLLRLWDNIRSMTMQSQAPALIHEEGDLIKRSIRDNYSRDIDEIQVSGDLGYRVTRDFMKMLMPSHVRRVQHYQDGSLSLFQRYQVETQIEQIHNPVVQLKSGGYIVINSTEALVAIDVNSGKATKERHIEETALNTNLEAAEEIARQLRLRDLAGLIVIDFIDMEERRNNTAVEKVLKDALRFDRARVQIGRISAFGLLEMSRQRLRPSLLETTFATCPHCGGTGWVRTTETASVHVLRLIEEEGMRARAGRLLVFTTGPVALHLLNAKRAQLHTLEERYGFDVVVEIDHDLPPGEVCRLEPQKGTRPEPKPTAIAPVPIAEDSPLDEEVYEDEEDVSAEVEDSGDEQDERQDGEGGSGSRRRRSRRRSRSRGRSREGDDQGPDATDGEGETSEAEEGENGESDDGGSSRSRADSDCDGDGDGDEGRSRRRRGRRGGRRRRRSDEGADSQLSADDDQGDGGSEDASESAEAGAVETEAETAPPTAADQAGDGAVTETAMDEDDGAPVDAAAQEQSPELASDAVSETVPRPDVAADEVEAAPVDTADTVPTADNGTPEADLAPEDIAAVDPDEAMDAIWASTADARRAAEQDALPPADRVTGDGADDDDAASDGPALYVAPEPPADGPRESAVAAGVQGVFRLQRDEETAGSADEDGDAAAAEGDDGDEDGKPRRRGWWLRRR